MGKTFFKGSPEAFRNQLKDRIAELEEVASCDNIDIDAATNSVAIPVGYETVEADDEIDDIERYVLMLSNTIPEVLQDKVDSCNRFSWDDSAVQFVVVKDGHIFEYSVPFEDLSLDIQDIESDVEYICDAVEDDIR